MLRLFFCSVFQLVEELNGAADCFSVLELHYAGSLFIIGRFSAADGYDAAYEPGCSVRAIVVYHVGAAFRFTI